ncbi:CerR family C-terminal domain-containing protein [bacterium]|nr:CerR family C-terminal domain-containing protein [bacterium]
MAGEVKKSEITKRKIMQSAIRLFAQKDFASVGTREIASDAGVNLSLISYYFSSKENLYTTIINYIVNLGLEYLSDVIKAADNINYMTKEEKIEAYINIYARYIEFVYSEKVSDNFVMLMIKEQGITGSEFGQIYRKKSLILYGALAKILASILNKKTTDPKVTFEICKTMGEILSYKFLKRIVFQGIDRQQYTKEDIELIKEILHDQIRLSIENIINNK